jgi:methylglutaconyl-CoA hydratase
VNDVVAAENLEIRVKNQVDMVLANSPSSLGATKWLMAEQNKSWLDTAIAHAMDANAQARETPDFQEGITAFMEKRKPAWTKI